MESTNPAAKADSTKMAHITMMSAMPPELWWVRIFMGAFLGDCRVARRAVRRVIRHHLSAFARRSAL